MIIVKSTRAIKICSEVRIEVQDYLGKTWFLKSKDAPTNEGIRKAEFKARKIKQAGWISEGELNSASGLNIKTSEFDF